MMDFSTRTDVELTKLAFDEKLGLSRAYAIVELARRGLKNSDLLRITCEAIASDRAIGFHKRAPVGWLAADEIYLSGQKNAIQALLNEMKQWNADEQADLVRHWAGKKGLAALTEEFGEVYQWHPRYLINHE